MKSEEIEKLLQDDDVTNATERSETYQELLEQGRSEFNQSSLKLHSILKDVAYSLLAAEKLTKQQAQRYHVSGKCTLSVLRALSVTYMIVPDVGGWCQGNSKPTHAPHTDGTGAKDYKFLVAPTHVTDFYQSILLLLNCSTCFIIFSNSG